MSVPLTRPLAGISGVEQRRSATEKETCARQHLFFGNSGALARVKRERSGAPWVKKFGKLSNRENLVMT